MPFRSEAQRRFLFANQPAVAERWAHTYGTPKRLPKHVPQKKSDLNAHVRATLRQQVTHG